MAPFLAAPIHSDPGVDNGQAILKGALIEVAMIRRKPDKSATYALN
jgi:hypothetical protein